MVVKRGLYSIPRAGRHDRLQKLRNLKWQAASWCSMSERSQICASVAPARREALRPRAVVACVPSLVGTPAAAVAAAGCASVSSRVPRRRALRRSGEVNGETDVRPNGLALGELHGPFTGELVSAAVPMDSRRRFKRSDCEPVAARQQTEGCKL